MTFASSGKHFRQFHTCGSNAENLPPEFVNLCKHPDIQVFINSRTCRCFHPSGLSDTVCIHGYRLDTIFLNTGKRRERTGCKKVGGVTQSYGTASATVNLSTILGYSRLSTINPLPQNQREPFRLSLQLALVPLSLPASSLHVAFCPTFPTATDV